MEVFDQLLAKNGLIFAFLLVGLLIYFSYAVSKYLFKGRIPGVAIAVLSALVLAFFGGEKGLADYPLFAGLAILGSSMFRDFTVVATAMGAQLSKIKAAGAAGVVALFAGVIVTFYVGAIMAYFMGYTDVKSMATIGAGACTYIVGPVTGSALGVSSDVIAISIAAGVVKTIVATVGTPLLAKYMKLDNAKTALVFGGLIGTTSGVTAGLAATNPKLVPYGAFTATFYTGLGCLLCPSILFITLTWFF
ncbi:MAG: malonate transporter subunit MadM [Flavobacteriaceae bacterium]|jgi:malonate transporter MadM subunit|nr:malonate transporter subunit MadM [Flavobacteriaceae bacterium]